MTLSSLRFSKLQLPGTCNRSRMKIHYHHEIKKHKQLSNSLVIPLHYDQNTSIMLTLEREAQRNRENNLCIEYSE